MRKKLKYVITVFILLLTAVILYTIAGENFIVTEYYTFESEKISNTVRVAAVSDLHNKEFGSGNIDLVNKIKEQNPDIIAVLGDMNIKDDPDNSIAVNFVNKITQVAPVYYCIGNHENNYQTVLNDIKNTDAVLLNDEITDINVNGEKITVAGLTGRELWDKKAGPLLEELNKKDNFTMLLCHYPDYYIDWLKDENFDIMLSGHAHGGQIRIPFTNQGVFAPEQGWWPKYTEGMHNLSEKSTLLITRGLYKSNWIPRFNNPPEIVVLDIT